MVIDNFLKCVCTCLDEMVISRYKKLKNIYIKVIFLEKF